MKYQKVIDAKKAQAAYDTWLAQGEAAAPAPAAAPAASPTPEAPAATQPSGPSEGQRALEQLDHEARLRLLLGLLPELAGEGDEIPRRIHLEAGGLRCTVIHEERRLTVAASAQGQPSSRVCGTAEALWTLLCGQDLEQARELFARAEITASSMEQLRWLVAACGDDPAGELAAELESRGTGVNRDAPGTTYHGDPLLVGADEILGFARATNDTNPWFVDPEREGGVVAPPLFAVRYYNTIFTRALTDPALKVDVTRLLFGEMAMTYNKPVHPRDLVVVKARVESLQDKDSGQVMRLACRLMCEGEALVESVATFFIRWDESRIQRIKESAGPGEVLGEVAFEELMKIREDQTRDFAEASNDPNPIHLDPEYASSMGLPGIIVHGLCSMAFCGKAFVDNVCDGDPARLASLKVRFSRPAQPGQTLSTRVYAPKTGEDGLKVYRFEARNDEGERIITHGVARVR